MRRTAPSALLLVLGIVAVQITRSEVYLRYVKHSLGPWLLLTGAILIAVGALGILTEQGERRHDVVPPRVGWLLLVPVALIALVTPPALGSYGLSGRATPVRTNGPSLGELPPAKGGAVELLLSDYSVRAVFAPATITGTRVRLVGFAVAPTAQELDLHGAGFYLTRITLSCCAADGQAVRVFVKGAARTTADTWWTVEGHPPEPPVGGPTPDGEQPDAVIVLDAMTPIAEPANPYSTQ